MTKNKQNKKRRFLVDCRQALKEAQTSGDEGQICLALANLGLAQFQLQRFGEGRFSFDAAIERAQRLDNIQVQAQCLGLKTLAYQEAERLPDAYNTAGEILSLAEAHDNKAMMCDALASQGQILLDSGEQINALERLEKANQIAIEIGDDRRLMNVLGALGNYCLVIASADKAIVYYDQALVLARKLGDRRAEYGFLGNKGTVLAYQGQALHAAGAFESVLAYVEEIGDQQAEVHVLRHIVRTNEKLEDDGKVLIYGQRGYELAGSFGNSEAALSFLEAIILAKYRSNQIEDARTLTNEAVNLARSVDDLDREVDLWLGLAESFMVMGDFQEALDGYEHALDGARQLGRQADEAYLIGRIGFTLAELGRTDEAIAYHEQAVELARQRVIPDLEGQQLSMLAMAYLERQDLGKARSYCAAAIQIYTDANLTTEADNARRLLAEINKDPLD
jgi:tetratricopeptide (TPR) repeat protein